MNQPLPQPGSNRRQFVKALSAVGAAAAALPLRAASIGVGDPSGAPDAGDRIDRHGVVTRHNITLDRIDPRNPLQVGNGEFAFACDVTGLQTLDDQLGTYSQWAWHTFENPLNLRYEDALEEYDSHGHKAKYASKAEALGIPGESGLHRTKEGAPPSAGDWYRRSPHRLHLGRIAFEMQGADGSTSTVTPERPTQTLDLWRGTIRSVFHAGGQPVEVTTCVHPHLDAVAVRIKSPLLTARRLVVSWQFPYTRFKDALPSWDAADEGRHTTAMTRSGAGRVDLQRRLGADRYFVAIAWSPAGAFGESRAHRFILAPTGGANELSFVTSFSAGPGGDLPDFATTLRVTEQHWANFWNSGAALDLSASRDPRWRELERRAVLAQYLTAIQTCGSAPPQESGLFANSWYGKFHLEMVTWHGTHYMLWGRNHLLDGWRKWQQEIGLPAARRHARSQGYEGARWMKMIDRYASWDSPSFIAPFRLTQNGHVIYLAELHYRLSPSRSVLETHRDMVFDTADFMADFVAWDDASKRYILGPPVYSGSESTRPASRAFNPTVELSYWFYGLRTAQLWRERLGLPRVAKWDRVLAGLSKPAVQDGRYLDAESHPGQWAGRAAWLEAYGCMPGVEIDPSIIARNYEFDAAGFNARHETWGCDFTMLAMTAARLGRPQEAVDWLVHPHPTNVWTLNGFNHGGSTPYLPAHGGLLWALAMMAAGWDGAPQRHAPGFPSDGAWRVRCEGFHTTP